MLHEDVQNFLHFHGIRLNTDLGQHFLIDETILARILDSAAVLPEDRVLEIGPGIGILTHELLSRGARVTAIEIDRRMIPLMKVYVTKGKSSHGEHLTVIEGNALHTDIPIEPPYKVVANIPYHITSPLLHRLFTELANRPVSLTLLVQKEVAENICATTTVSMLTVLTQLFGSATYVCDVPPECFLPRPAVDSAVIHIRTHTTPLTDPETSLRILSLVQHAMSGRRKMLRNTVGSLPHGMDALDTSGVEATRRPQTLTIEEWITLEKALRTLR